MSSLPEQSSAVSVWHDNQGSVAGEGGHDDWNETQNRPPQLPPSSTPSEHPKRNLSRANLPRNYTTQTLGRTARSSSEQYRKPPLVERLASSRSLFIPSVVYSGERGDEVEGEGSGDWRSTAVGETPLDRTMDRIGMGRYQWTVLILSGLGWAADNMWIQAIAIILPHIQRYFTLTDGTVGLASSSIFIGMFVGSIMWGTISDSYGRRAAFNITLLVTAIFGTLSAFAGSFTLLCLLLFAVGTGVGGSMPTDSSNLVENLPVRNHNYVTALSVFFSAGAVVPSLIGLLVLSSSAPQGWRWLLGSLAVVTTAFVAARVVFFRLLESPKYLVHAGRPKEARDILHKIMHFNGGEPINLRIQDVCDGEGTATDPAQVPGRDPSSHLEEGGSAGSSLARSSDSQSRPASGVSKHGQNGCRRDQHHQDEDEEEGGDDDTSLADESNRPLLSNSHGNSEGGRGDQGDGTTDAQPQTPGTLPKSLSWLPKSWHPNAADFLSRYAELFAPEWKRTTVLVWIIWGGMSFGYTTFNVLLPKLLEERYGSQPSSPNLASDSSLSDDATRQAMIDILIYSLSSLPGSLISAYMVETKLGRIGTMALSTACMAGSVLLFSLTFWRAVLTLVSITSSISYAAIYGYTPEVMSPKIRATACGTASAISRVAGIIAPITAGWAFSITPSIPLFVATTTLVIVALAMVMLPIETRGRGSQSEVS